MSPDWSDLLIRPLKLLITPLKAVSACACTLLKAVCACTCSLRFNLGTAIVCTMCKALHVSCMVTIHKHMTKCYAVIEITGHSFCRINNAYPVLLTLLLFWCMNYFLTS